MPTNDLLKTDDFTIWQPGVVEVLKSDNSDERRIGGYCSTEHLDRQEEVVLQKGLDFSDFVNYGYFNDNHNQATAAVVGVPEKAEFHKGKGWYTTGHMLKGFSRADEIWNLAKSLEGTKRRLGFSIEGKVLERANNKIVKAKIRNVAVTNCPVNPNCTWEVLAKSFDGKALTAGHAIAPTSGGRVLVPEDLEHDEVRKIWKCTSCGKAFRSEGGYKDHENAHKSMEAREAGIFTRRQLKVLSKSEALLVLHRLRPQYSKDACKRIVEFALRGE